MAETVRILAFAGSARRDSFNRKLLAIAVAGARDAGAEVNVFDFAEFPLPLYNGDLEDASGLPENAKKFKTTMREHHGLLIACPEYNSSITPLLKNAIDWASRPEKGPDGKPEPSLVAYQNKVAGLVSASPGALGGMRGLRHVREILMNINVLVLPQQFTLSKANEAFDGTGRLLDPKAEAGAKGVAAKLVATLSKLR